MAKPLPPPATLAETNTSPAGSVLNRPAKGKNPNSATGDAQMSFRVDPEFKAAFKVFAAQHGMTQTDYLIKCHEFYQEHFGKAGK